MVELKSNEMEQSIGLRQLLLNSMMDDISMIRSHSGETYSTYHNPAQGHPWAFFKQTSTPKSLHRN